MVRIIVLCFLLQGCTMLIHNEYYQFIDRSITVYDTTTLLTDKQTTTELLIETLTTE